MSLSRQEAAGGGVKGPGDDARDLSDPAGDKDGVDAMLSNFCAFSWPFCHGVPCNSCTCEEAK